VVRSIRLLGLTTAQCIVAAATGNCPGEAATADPSLKPFARLTDCILRLQPQIFIRTAQCAEGIRPLCTSQRGGAQGNATTNSIYPAAMSQSLKNIELTTNVIVRAIQDDATMAGDPQDIFGPGKARDSLNASFEACGNETHPQKSVAYCIRPQDRELVPAGVSQPSFVITDAETGSEIEVFGVEVCGAPIGETGYRREWLRLKSIEISEKIDKISNSVATIDPHCSTAITVYSLQSLADFVLATNYPSETVEFVNTVDEALKRAFTKSHGTNLLAPEQSKPPGSEHPDPSFISDRSRLRTSKGGAAIRMLSNRQLYLNSLCGVIPQLIDHADFKNHTRPIPDAHKRPWSRLLRRCEQ